VCVCEHTYQYLGSDLISLHSVDGFDQVSLGLETVTLEETKVEEERRSAEERRKRGEEEERRGERNIKRVREDAGREWGEESAAKPTYLGE
jgi:hypothetical protein